MPILKEKIWGGTNLREILNKDSQSNKLGESWEISGVEKNISVVENGELAGKTLNELLKEYRGDFLGKKVYTNFGAEFPLLIKFIDASTELSVQVHPNDELASLRHNSFGKTEMWYIIQADVNAEINVGFKETISKEEYLKKLHEGEISKILNFEKVQKGDSFLINTGKVHAIGAGVLLAEIQQTSDITYRIYDWDRTDSEGKSRELHTEEALDAIDFEKKDDFRLKYSKTLNGSSNIASCKYFTTNYLPVKGKLKKDYSGIDSFVIYICVSGNAEIQTNGHSEMIEQGQTIFIPAICPAVNISAKNVELLEVYIG